MFEYETFNLNEKHILIYDNKIANFTEIFFSPINQRNCYKENNSFVPF